MNLVRILLLVFLIYAAMKQKSEESRNIILIVTGLLAVCMMNQEGFLVKCSDSDSNSDSGTIFGEAEAEGRCFGNRLGDCTEGQVRHAETGLCQDSPAPLPSCAEDEVRDASTGECKKPCPTGESCLPSAHFSPCKIEDCNQSCWFYEDCDKLQKCADGSFLTQYCSPSPSSTS